MRFLIPSLPSGAGSSPPPTTASVSAQVIVPGSAMIVFQVALSQDSNGNTLQVILTNQSQAQAVYTANLPKPDFWDSMFQETMVQALRAFLVPALSLNMQLMQVAIAQAEDKISKARAADGNETVVTQDHVPDFILARAGAASLAWGYGYGGLYSPWLGSLYSNIAWPQVG